MASSRCGVCAQPSTGLWIPLSSTPGGSLYGTTPGGSRIAYDRASLLNLRNSPLSKSPATLPAAIINLGVTTSAVIPEERPSRQSSGGSAAARAAGGQGAAADDDELFDME